MKNHHSQSFHVTFCTGKKSAWLEFFIYENCLISFLIDLWKTTLWSFSEVVLLIVKKMFFFFNQKIEFILFWKFFYLIALDSKWHFFEIIEFKIVLHFAVKRYKVFVTKKTIKKYLNWCIKCLQLFSKVKWFKLHLNWCIKCLKHFSKIKWFNLVAHI